MPIKGMLDELIQKLPEAKGVILADWEGEAVDHVARMDEYDLKILGAHIGIILTRLRQTVDPLTDPEGLQELVITTKDGYNIVCPVSEDYFVVLSLTRDGLLGRALFEGRRCVRKLQAEIL